MAICLYGYMAIRLLGYMAIRLYGYMANKKKLVFSTEKYDFRSLSRSIVEGPGPAPWPGPGAVCPGDLF